MSTIDEWRKMHVSEYYVEKLKDFLNYIRKHGMKWSDIIVTLGSSDR